MVFEKIRNKVVQYFVLEKSLSILILVSLLYNMSDSLWEPLLGVYVTENLVISALMFGLMNTTYQLVYSLIAFPAGFLSDNFGRKNMIITSIIFYNLALLTLIFIKTLPWIFFVTIFLGLSYAFMEPSRSAYVIDVTPDERRGSAFATLALFQNFSGIITTSIAGIIAYIFGFYWVFGIALALGFISILWTIIYMRESLTKSTIETKRSKESFLKQFKNGVGLLKNPPLLSVLLSIVFHQLGLGIQSPYLTIYASKILNFSLPAISLMLGLQQLGIFLGHFPSGKIVDKYGGEMPFAMHIFVTSPSMILLTIAGTPYIAGLILFVWGLTFGVDSVSRQKLIPKYRSESGIAMAFGMISLIAGIVSLISPTIGGWVWTNFSPQAVFYASAAVNVLGSLPLFILWIYIRKSKKDN